MRCLAIVLTGLCFAAVPTASKAQDAAAAAAEADAPAAAEALTAGAAQATQAAQPSQAAQDAAETAATSNWGRLSLAAFAGGGWGAANEADLVKFVRLADPDSVDVGRDDSWRWRPTVTGGVELRIGDTLHQDDFYFGVAGFFAALSTSEESNAVAPGLALVIADGPIGFNLGWIFTQSDDIVLPGGMDRVTVAKDNIPNFRTVDTRSLGRLFIGFRGVAVTF